MICPDSLPEVKEPGQGERSPKPTESAPPFPARKKDSTGNQLLDYHDSKGYYSILGEFNYVDAWGDTIPIYNSSGLIFYYDEYYDVWDLEDYFETDENGGFYIVTDKQQVCVFIRPFNQAACVITTLSHNWGPGEETIYYTYGFQLNNYTWDNQVNVPIEYTTNTATPGAFYIADRIRDGYESFNSLTGHLPPYVFVFWDSLNTESTNSYCGRYSMDGRPTIYINSRDTVSDNDFDEWDAPVILHEYSHYLVYMYAQSSPFAGGYHAYITIPQVLCTLGICTRPPDVAYNEGLANFMQGVFRNSADYSDSAYNRVKVTILIERPYPDAPYTLDYNIHNTDNPPRFNGPYGEAPITETLWDIYDNADDEKYYHNGLIYGYNNDHNSPTNWNGFDAIWGVIESYDPWPDDDDHDNSWNMFEFLQGWGELQYPVDSVFKNILSAHNVYMVIPGDGNNDGYNNLADAVYIINYIFRSGPPPEIKEAGDANCDNALNIGDAIYIIDYIFRGGAAPVLCLEYTNYKP